MKNIYFLLIILIGFKHSAFALFYESKLENILKENMDDLKPGMLIHYLERGLLLN